jgi:hypothetical protein
MAKLATQLTDIQVKVTLLDARKKRMDARKQKAAGADQAQRRID